MSSIFLPALIISFLLNGNQKEPLKKDCGTATEMVMIPAGEHQPFMAGEDKSSVHVPSFYMDKYPVTNRQFRQFLKSHPRWQKENLKPLFADEGYLKHWKDRDSGGSQNGPVTNISWYAAQAYCECQGKRLPEIYEWEYAAASDLISKDNKTTKPADEVVLQWYSSPSDHQLPDVGSTYINLLGVYDMHGLIWEWVHDFNSVMLPNDARNKKELEELYCAAGALGAADPSDYASFLRYGLRSSLKANYTLHNLGFRCVKEKKN